MRLEVLIDSLKKKYDFKIDQESLSYFVDSSDSLRFGMVHPKYEEISVNVLFSYAGKTVDDWRVSWNYQTVIRR